MKSAWVFFALLVSVPWCLAATPTGYQHGIVIRMHMGDCVLAHHGFMATFGPPQQPIEDSCPEYTLLADKVVFVIVGKSAHEFVPLAEEIEFRFQKNELAVRVDDERKESKFVIKEMTLRSQWDMVQQHIEEELKSAPREMDHRTVANRE